MKTSLAAICFSLLCACGAGASDPSELKGRESTQPRPIDDVMTDPFEGTTEQVRGFYSKGKLLNAVDLPLEGFGFVKLFRARLRGFSSYDMGEILKHVSGELQRKFPSRDRVMIGDISSEHGDDLSGHASHQNGLDADVGFLRLDQTEQDPDDLGGFREQFVSAGKLAPNFDLARNWEFAKLAIATGRVQRIFVGEVIKKSLCNYARSLGELDSAKETLRRLRVESGHTDHFHVRITCPRSSPACKPQEEVPDSTGC